MSDVELIPYDPTWQEAVLQLTLRAWRPVFKKTQNEVPPYVYNAFYPDGWEKRQTGDVTDYLTGKGLNCWLAVRNGELAGFVGLRTHPEDKMGEIHILAVDPACQRQGIGKLLMNFAEDRMRSEGLSIIMVETVGDSGHAPARAAYEARCYEQWPVARYFKKL